MARGCHPPPRSDRPRRRTLDRTGAERPRPTRARRPGLGPVGCKREADGAAPFSVTRFSRGSTSEDRTPKCGARLGRGRPRVRGVLAACRTSRSEAGQYGSREGVDFMAGRAVGRSSLARHRSGGRIDRLRAVRPARELGVATRPLDGRGYERKDAGAPAGSAPVLGPQR